MDMNLKAFFPIFMRDCKIRIFNFVEVSQHCVLQNHVACVFNINWDECVHRYTSPAHVVFLLCSNRYRAQRHVERNGQDQLKEKLKKHYTYLAAVEQVRLIAVNRNNFGQSQNAKLLDVEPVLCKGKQEDE